MEEYLYFYLSIHRHSVNMNLYIYLFILIHRQKMKGTYENGRSSLLTHMVKVKEHTFLYHKNVDIKFSAHGITFIVYAQSQHI